MTPTTVELSLGVRAATIGLGLLAIALGIAFKEQNVTSTFPVLVLAIYRNRLIAMGASGERHSLPHCGKTQLEANQAGHRA